MKNFKKRWFRLTNHEFTYQKSKGNKTRSLFTCFHIFYSKGSEPHLGPRGAPGCFWGEHFLTWEVGALRGWPGWRVSGWTPLSRMGGLVWMVGIPRGLEAHGSLRGDRPLLELMACSAAGDVPLYSIPIENILAVEPLEEESFKMKNVSPTPTPPHPRPWSAPGPVKQRAHPAHRVGQDPWGFSQSQLWAEAVGPSILMGLPQAHLC